MKVLVLGGTGEARALATALAARPGVAVTSSLAGAVAEPALPPGAVRVGGFGGVAGLAAWLREDRVDAVVDATHPFAATITAHAVSATAAVGVPLLVLRRPGWTSGPGDRWVRVPDAAAAAAVLRRPGGPSDDRMGVPDADAGAAVLRRPGGAVDSGDDRMPDLEAGAGALPGERVFLATGRGDLAAFAGLDRWFLLRAVDPPPPPLPARHHLVLARGPFPLAGERALLDEHRIDVVVTRDSGGDGAKLVAARERGLPVLVIDRPPAPPTPTAATVAEALAWLDARC